MRHRSSIILCSLSGALMLFAFSGFKILNQKQFNKDCCASITLDVTNKQNIKDAFDTAALNFGGIDIIVNCAGLSISKPLEEHTEKDWDLLYDVLVKGQFLITQAGVEVMHRDVQKHTG